MKADNLAIMSLRGCKTVPYPVPYKACQGHLQEQANGRTNYLAALSGAYPCQV